MGREQTRVRLRTNDLLTPLNEIADFAIGNERPEDCGYGELSTLPEHLSYFQMNPNSKSAARRAYDKYELFVEKVLALREKIRVMKKKIEIKYKRI